MDKKNFFKNAKDDAGFTKGPWFIEHHGNDYALFSREDEGQHGLNLMYISDPDWNFKANKRLIEAAPELYNELNKLVQTLVSLGHYIDVSSSIKVLEKVKNEVD